MAAGILYIVATPIGNLEDITMRAVRVLKEASVIAAEDTRQTKKLLERYGIATPMTSYFEHNEKSKSVSIVGKILSGADVALVSDAGTPGVSDPGYRLVKLAIENNVRIVPIPGPSAMLSVLSVSGFPMDSFSFKGFAPTALGARKKFLLQFKGGVGTYVFFDSPNRIASTLECVTELLGEVQVVIGREMTKVHEEVLRGTSAEILKTLAGREILGEITVVLRIEEPAVEDRDLETELKKLFAAGVRLKDAVKAVSDELNLPRSDVYKAALMLRTDIHLRTGGGGKG